MNEYQCNFSKKITISLTWNILTFSEWILTRIDKMENWKNTLRYKKAVQRKFPIIKFIQKPFKNSFEFCNNKYTYKESQIKGCSICWGRFLQSFQQNGNLIRVRFRAQTTKQKNSLQNLLTRFFTENGYITIFPSNSGYSWDFQYYLPFT